MNIVYNNINFNFKLFEEDKEWYCKTFINQFEIEIFAPNEILSKNNVNIQLNKFTEIISLNFEKLIEKTQIWTKTLYNELGDFENEKGYFENEIFISLKSIENETFFIFQTEIPFHSEIDLIMDINHSYLVHFKSIYEKIFVEGITRE
ncbi:hypothetical protein [Empedobacter tilapiae]|uniref:hypothetical protein n=1 Tax=Empedobacter tilapiae TaxID=2491114 RepID=UPI0028D4DF1D|nr:hypothetical protein [Empedobacter tilapiae]